MTQQSRQPNPGWFAGECFARPAEVPTRCLDCNGAVVRRHVGPGLRCEWRCVRCGREWQYGEARRA